MAFIVALTRLSTAASTDAGRGAEAAVLSPLIGMGAYELRVALGGGLPLVLATLQDAERARELLAALRARGHGAVACDDAKVEGNDRMASPRDFSLEAQALVGDASGVRVELAFADMLALVAATHLRSEATTLETSQKKFSLGRAALTGGLVRNKTTTTTEHRSVEEREPVLYLLRRQGSGHLLLAESRLRYGGLGERRAPAAYENFRTLVALLRERAPDVLYDDRLLTQKRAAGSLSISGAGKSRSLASSNAAETDLAVHLIAVAHLQGQL